MKNCPTCGQVYQTSKVDYKAAYELLRVDNKRLALLGVQLTDLLSQITDEPAKSNLLATKKLLTEIILDK